MAKYRVIILITQWSMLIGYLQHTVADCSVSTHGVQTFGSECQFMCHCKNGTSCDTTTGECNQGCASNWYGPACQYRDLAEGQYSRHNSNTDPPKYSNFAHDGDTSTCSYTRSASSSTSQPWWRVWFSQNETIRDIDLTTTESMLQYFENGYEVSIEFVPENKKTDNVYIPPTKQMCFKYNGGPLSSKDIHVKCEQPLVGNQVRIKLSAIKSQLSLCDVRINGGRNFAFRKTVSSNSQSDDTMYLPSNAIDGRIPIAGLTGCFASSGSVNIKNLDIDLGRLYYIYSVNITTSSDECPANRCGHDCSENCYCSSSIEDIEQRINGVCIDGCTGRWTGTNEKCNIECDETKWGPSCQSYCGACRTGPCDVVSGDCSGGCRDGFYNYDNKCFTECQDGWYGSNCATKCSEHCKGGKCINTNGVCEDGCEPGYLGDKCDRKCLDKTYGDKCSQTCNTQCIDVCNHVNGTCENCVDGWKGDFCNEECPYKTYGDKCSQTCNNHCTDVCNHVNGTCKNCAAGWKGYFCNEVCPDKTYGDKCSQTCNSQCIDVCNHVNGTCKNCTAGWKGGYCHEECDDGTFGSGCEQICSPRCLNPCDKADGSCSQCKHGWMGPDCDTECSGGFYGINCRQKCSDHCVDICNKEIGSCSCTAGWKGYTCHNECDDGTHGDGCLTECGNCKEGAACDKINGSCIAGCAAGYNGSLCVSQKESTDDKKSTPTAIIAGGVSTAVVITAIVLVVFIVVIWRRKKIIQSRNPMDTKLTDNVNVEAAAIQTAAYETVNAANRQLSNEEYVYDELEMRTDSVYYNTSLSTHQSSPLPIKLTALLTYVKQGLSNFNISTQFKEIPYGLQKLFETNAARNPDNTSKNMYKDIYPYDHCRVILKPSKPGAPGDYINASHIKDYRNEIRYIAAQGPSKTTVNDFWKMIWEKDIRAIAMVTNLVEKRKMMCIQYWAPSKQFVQYGDIKIFTESEDVYTDFSVRRFKIYLSGTSLTRDVVHFAYTSWPDEGVPNTTSSLLHFWQRVRKIDSGKTHPWLVHCSNGVGRTGTFIALDFLYDQGQETGQVNVFQCVKDLRNQRVNMVQTEEQYFYLYMIVLDALVLSSQPVTIDEFELHYKKHLEVDTKSGNQKLKLEYEALKETHVAIPNGTWFKDSDLTKDIQLHVTDTKSKGKNRFSNILAPDEYRPSLGTAVDGTSNYINAIYMPRYYDLHGIIITQTPLSTTAVDHCRLIVEQKVHVIVTFDEIETGNAGKYLPDTGTVELRPYRVSVESEENKDGYIMRKHTLFYNTKVHRMTQFIYKAWAPSNVCPDDPYQMLNFLQNVDSIQILTKDKPLIVECMNGAARSGLIVALMNILEYVRIDGEVSIPNVIRCLQARRQQIIPNYEQYKFCHDVLLCYVRRESKHANFN